jgi:hypothetical protein
MSSNTGGAVPVDIGGADPPDAEGTVEEALHPVQVGFWVPGKKFTGCYIRVVFFLCFEFCLCSLQDGVHESQRSQYHGCLLGTSEFEAGVLY